MFRFFNFGGNNNNNPEDNQPTSDEDTTSENSESDQLFAEAKLRLYRSRYERYLQVASSEGDPNPQDFESYCHFLDLTRLLEEELNQVRTQVTQELV